jgi:hypothetical protein
MMNANTSVEVDVDPDLDARDLEKMAANFSVTVKLLQEHGPGGGCPLYQFDGTEFDLRNFLRAHFNPGLPEGPELESEIDFMMGIFDE